MKYLKTYENFKLNETGEADSDYKDEQLDEIIEQLEKAGYVADYKEFDKYHGVYLFIKSVGKFWVTDRFSRGKWGKGYISSTLIDDEGNTTSGNKGDYFQLEDDYVFQGFTLTIKKLGEDGKPTTVDIENPKVSDLPDTIGTKTKFTSENEIIILTPDEDISVEIEYVVGSNNIDDLLSYIEENKK